MQVDFNDNLEKGTYIHQKVQMFKLWLQIFDIFNHDFTEVPNRTLLTPFILKLQWQEMAAVAQEEEQLPTNQKVCGSTLATPVHLSKNPTDPIMHPSVYECECSKKHVAV